MLAVNRCLKTLRRAISTAAWASDLRNASFEPHTTAKMTALQLSRSHVAPSSYSPSPVLQQACGPRKSWPASAYQGRSLPWTPSHPITCVGGTSKLQRSSTGPQRVATYAAEPQQSRKQSSSKQRRLRHPRCQRQGLSG